MKSRSFCPSLLRWTILILSTLDNTLLSASLNAGAHHQRVSRRIHLPHAINTSRKFPCSEPQSRAYNMRDLIQNSYQNPGESANQPVYIVLKRCDNHAGCCTNTFSSCAPVQSAIYYDEIEIQMWNVETNDTRLQWIRVEQHGRCECKFTTMDERYQSEHQQPNVILV